MGKLYVVATPIGNLSDISPRAAKCLAEVDIIAAEDTRRTMKLLAHLGIKTKVVSSHKYNEAERNWIIDAIAAQNIDAAIVSDAGTPCISDPGGVLVDSALKQGIEVVALPGPSSVTAALSVCGFSFTSFAFHSFAPRTKKERTAFLTSLFSSDIDTHVFFESPKRIADLFTFISGFLSEDSTPARFFVINDITKLHERAYRGSAGEILEKLAGNPSSDLGEYTVVVNFAPQAGAGGSSPAQAELPPEALLAGIMAEEGVDVKTAVGKAAERYANISKKAFYSASLRLKSMFSDD